MTDQQRISCPRHHWIFSITAQGIEYKCRAGECRAVYTITWAELDAKRREVTPLQQTGADGKIAV